MMIISALAALALFAAQDAAPAASGAVEVPVAAPKKKCVKQPEVSGSRLAKKVCVVEKPKASAPAEAQADGQTIAAPAKPAA